MANKMIFSKSYKNIGVQTGQEGALTIYMSQNKIARVYYSHAYKDNVLSFNFGTSKSFIITSLMWKILKNHITDIDELLK